MTPSSAGLAAPFALIRFRADDGQAPRLGLVAGDRVREIGPEELGAPDLNAFLAEAPASWERLRPLAEQPRRGVGLPRARPSPRWGEAGSLPGRRARQRLR